MVRPPDPSLVDTQSLKAHSYSARVGGEWTHSPDTKPEKSLHTQATQADNANVVRNGPYLAITPQVSLLRGCPRLLDQQMYQG